MNKLNMFDRTTSTNIVENFNLLGSYISDIKVSFDKIVILFKYKDNYNKRTLTFSMAEGRLCDVSFNHYDVKGKKFKAIYRDYESKNINGHKIITVNYKLEVEDGKVFSFSFSSESEGLPCIVFDKDDINFYYNIIDISSGDDDLVNEISKHLDIKGKTVLRIQGFVDDYDDIIKIYFHLNDGYILKFYHRQMDTEKVYLEKYSPNIDDMVNSKILNIEERIKRISDKLDDSSTKTIYEIKTTSGVYTLEWLGISDGYYPERPLVEFNKHEELTYYDEDIKNELHNN